MHIHGLDRVATKGWLIGYIGQGQDFNTGIEFSTFTIFKMLIYSILINTTYHFFV